nr:MAG TPA: major capsid protein [Caudoviricetes sp.]
MATNTNVLLFNAEEFERQTYNNMRSTLKASNALDITTLGLNRAVTTLTYLIKDVIEAKYYTVPMPLTDYVKINASGEGAYMKNIAQLTQANLSASFKECVINPFSTGIHNDPTADVALDEIQQKNNFFRQSYSITHEEMQAAGRAMIPYNIVEGKERSRTTNWQLGIQDTMFIGLGDNRTFGLLNQTEAIVDTSLLPVGLDKMTPEQLNTWVGTVLNAYGAGNNYNFMPNRLYLPTPMYLALSKQMNPNFPLKNLRQTIEDAFSEVTGDFKIVHAAYGMDLGTKNLGRAVLYNNDAENLVMHTPVPYRPLPLFPVNSLDMISQSEGQFTGAWLKRPTTMLYMDVQAAANAA